MRLSTMTSLVYRPYPDGRTLIHALRAAHAAGFRVMDLNMCPLQRGETELGGEGNDWERYLDELLNEASKLGVELAQSHLPYPRAAVRRKKPTDPGCEQNEYFVNMTLRAIEISARAGIKWAVVHPVQRVTDADIEDDLRYNHEIYDRYVELASARGVGLAFENMAEVEGRQRSFSTGDDLCRLVESFGADVTGICWDFGHANHTFVDQCTSLRRTAPYLRVTHLDDNRAKDDLHIVPYMGTVDWEKVMRTLREMGYAGDLNYELSIYRHLPDELLAPTLEYVYRVGQYLVSLYEKN